ncbi:MAG TPA: DUF2076 family protein [Candidatus Dormibacteraeota bacterium]
MTPQERQLIESLFQRLAQAAAQAGPRDPEAEALIQQRVQSMPGAAYSMAQTLLVQERALQEAEARLGAGQQGGSFLPPSAGSQAYRAAPPYAGQPYAAPQQQWRGGGGSGVGGFLAGAGQMALGIGGGILVADAAMSLAEGLFGGGGFGFGQGEERAYDDGFQRGYDEGQRDDQQQDDSSSDDGAYDQQDDSGDFGGDSGDW